MVVSIKKGGSDGKREESNIIYNLLSSLSCSLALYL